MSKTKSDDRMYTDTPCNKCGGPTLQIGAGSIWCPDEDAHPGGHFVVRVAFAQPPKRDANGDWERNAAPQRVKRQPVERIASTPTSAPVKVRKDDGFGGGYDDFVKGDR
jgi:hypothetical protein